LERTLKDSDDDILQLLLKFLTCPVSQKVFRNPIMLETGETVDYNKGMKSQLCKSKLNPLHADQSLKLTEIIPNKHVMKLIKALALKEELAG